MAEPKDKEHGRAIGVIAIVVIAISAFANRNDAPEPEEEAPVAVASAPTYTPINSCAERGVAYFKEIGSYPTLSNGRDAQSEATERCARTTTAF